MSANSNVILLITAENKASQVLQQVQQEATKTEGEITKANQNIAQSTQKVNTSMLQTVGSFAAIGAGAVGLVTSFTTLERAQIGVETAHKRLITAQASAESAQKAYNAAVAKFGPDSEQAHIALLRLQAANEQLPIAEDKARLAQDRLTETYLNFAANIAPQVISLIVGIQGASARLATTSLSSLIPSIRGVGIAMITSFITNPVGIAIIAITTVVILLATNVGGLRDKVVELGNEILAFIDVHLKPLGDAIRFLIDLFKPLVNIFHVVMPSAMARTRDSITELEDVAVPAYSKIESTAVNLGTAIGVTMDKIKTKHKEAVDGVEAVLEKNMQLYDRLGRTAEKVESDVVTATTGMATGTVKNSITMITGLTAVEAAFARVQALANAQQQNTNETTSLLQRIGYLPEDQSAWQSVFLQGIKNSQAISEQMGAASRQAQSLLLAAGVTARQLFGTQYGGYLVGPSGTVFSPGMLQAVTPGGTLASYVGAPGGSLAGSYVISNPLAAIARGYVGSIGSTGIVHAQKGFDEIVHKPTLFLAGEAGPEHVNILPTSSMSKTASTVLDLLSSVGPGGVPGIIPTLLSAITPEIAHGAIPSSIPGATQGKSLPRERTTINVIVDRTGRLIGIEDEVSRERVPLMKASKARSIV